MKPTNTSTTQVKYPHQRYEKFLAWRQLHLTDSGFVLFLALLTGLLTGVSAWLLKLMIGSITNMVTSVTKATHYDWLIIIVPVVGISLAALFCRYILRRKVDNGVTRMVTSINNKDYMLSAKDVYGSMIASALTLGFGGTAGSEGPIAYAGGGIGSKLGQFFGVSKPMLMILVGCGAAAGIAGIFKAPIGGALFTIEVLRIELSTIAILGVFLSTLTAAMTAYSLSGCTFDINVISPGAFDNSTMLWVILLGIICGIYSLYYTHTGSVMKKLLDSRKSQVSRWLISGVSIGVMIYLFPTLYGEGYTTITDVINMDSSKIIDSGIITKFDGKIEPLIIACCGILLLKGIGSSATNNGGGVAGDFAPTLFAGCILGLLFATVVNYTGLAELNAGQYALIAMAGSMAGIIRAPLMAIFLTTEMVGGIEFLLPASIVALISYGMLMIFKRDTFYHSQAYTTPNLE